MCGLALLATGCDDGGVVLCAPCGSQVQIWVSGLTPWPSFYRICVGTSCGPVTPMPALDHENSQTLWVNGPFDRTRVVLETTRAGRRLATYRIDGLYVRPPSGHDCDCGDTALLLPAADGRLVRH